MLRIEEKHRVITVAYILPPATKTCLKPELLKKAARILRRYRPLLLNRFRAKEQFFSVIVNGFNTNADLIRIAHGFKTCPPPDRRPVSYAWRFTRTDNSPGNFCRSKIL